MVKIISVALRTLVLLAGFASSLWFFMPWKEVGEFVLASASGRMSPRWALSYAAVESAGSGFTVKELSVKGLVKCSFGSVTFRPNLIATLLNRAPTGGVVFSDGNVFFGQPVRLGDGQVSVVLDPQEILLEQVHTNGDFAVRGLIGIDPKSARISRAEAAIQVTEALEPNLNSLKSLLPLEQETSGRWVLRRQVGQTKAGTQ